MAIKSIVVVNEATQTSELHFSVGGVVISEHYYANSRVTSPARPTPIVIDYRDSDKADKAFTDWYGSLRTLSPTPDSVSKMAIEETYNPTNQVLEVTCKLND